MLCLTLVGKSFREEGDVGGQEGAVDQPQTGSHLHVALTVVPEIGLDELDAALDSR